jgi:hypothetical protein
MVRRATNEPSFLPEEETNMPPAADPFLSTRHSKNHHILHSR